MNKSLRLTIGLGVALAIALLLSSVVSLFQPAKKPSGPQPVVRDAPSVGIPQPSGVTFSFSAQPSLPAGLPVYAYTDYSRGQLESAIRLNTGFYGIPASSSSLIRAGLFSESWEGDGATFSLSQDGDTTTVSFRQFRVESQPSSPAPSSDTARRFITSLFTFPGAVFLTQSDIVHEVSEGLLILDSFIPSSLDGVLFSYTLEGHPIVSPPHGPNATAVIVDNYGVIRSATILPPPASVSKTGQTPLLTPEGITKNLDGGRGAIIAAGKAGGEDVTGKVDFSSFLIDKTTVVYSRNGASLAPAFLLHGFGTNKAGKKQEATFFLWGSAQ